MSRTMRYRLALDLGSTSLGWALIRLKDAKPCAIIKAGVRIFSDGRNPKDGSSLAVTRREARAMRRRRDRLLKRRTRMRDQLVEYGFFPDDPLERKVLEQLNPYHLRVKGLSEPLEPGEFARAIFHLNQRRGFKSNRRTDSQDKDNDSSALKQAIGALRDQMQETGCRTVGEWFWKVRMQERLQGVKGQGVRARYRETSILTDEGKKRVDKSYDLYVDRDMVAEEFDKLWEKQKEFNPARYCETARAALRDTLIYQRNLRPVKPGRCTLLPEEERALRALPSTQRFRIYQEVNNLRILDDSLRETPLTLEQRNRIVEMLDVKNKVTFDQIRRALRLSGTMKFNLEDVKRKELKGNATAATLSRKDLFGSTWAQFDLRLQDNIVEQLLTEESEGELIVWLRQQTGIDEIQAKAIDKAKLTPGYGNLSRCALDRILPALERMVIPYSDAVRAAGFEHHSDLGFDFEHMGEDVEQIGERTIESTGEIKPVFVFKQLPYYGHALQRHVGFGSNKPEDPDEKRYGRIANPTVHIGLNQVRVVVNALIHRYGRPTEVIIEVARELKQSREQKAETQKQQADNQKRNDRIRKSIADIRQISEARVSREDREKWILWEELSSDVADRRCPYSGVQISASLLLSEQVEIEHILPFSQTLDDSLNNKTVAMRQANRIKRNRSPWKARDDFEAQGWKYEDILQRAQHMPKLKCDRFAPDGYERRFGDGKDFLARALNDTRHLSRVAASYLKLVCPQGTRVIPGGMTALLRGKFGLHDILSLKGEKNRNDHRHHAVDACVIGVTDQGMLQSFAEASARTREGGLSRLVEDMPLPWSTYPDHVKRAIHHLWVSHRPDHGHEGAMMEDTAHGFRRNGEFRLSRKSLDKGKKPIPDNLIKIRNSSQLDRHGVDEHGQPRPYKGYQGGSNYCIEITANDKGKWVGDVISTFEAYQIVREQGEEKGRRLLRHPMQSRKGRPLVMRLMIGDSVRLRLKAEEPEQTMRVVKIDSSGKITMAPVHEANVDKRNSDKQDPFKYTYKSGDAFRQAKARQVTISPIGEVSDPGFRG